jgi:hypothetical protein
MGDGTRSALDVAAELVAVLGVDFGEVTVQVLDGEVVLVRQGMTMKPADLENIPARAAS